tara:strand:+ start:91 stop:522 length:432 start_codon:yes stop_codon:yes gene_type:complete
LYEGGIRVPGIAVWPEKINSGTRVEVPCYTSDYFPTIAHVLGIDIMQYNPPYDGDNLMHYWKGEKNKRQQPMMFQFENQYAVIDNDFKLYGTVEALPQLYNIVEDNAEAHDLSSQQQSTLSNLISRYNTWSQSLQNSALAGDY